MFPGAEPYPFRFELSSGSCWWDFDLVPARMRSLAVDNRALRLSRVQMSSYVSCCRRVAGHGGLYGRGHPGIIDCRGDLDGTDCQPADGVADHGRLTARPREFFPDLPQARLPGIV